MLVQLKKKEGASPPVLFLQVDNMTQTKEKWLLDYLAVIVRQNIFYQVYISFHSVGHTHVEVDQVFRIHGRVSALVRYRNELTAEGSGLLDQDSSHE
jgi:predicted helicase